MLSCEHIVQTARVLSCKHIVQTCRVLSCEHIVQTSRDLSCEHIVQTCSVELWKYCTNLQSVELWTYCTNLQSWVVNILYKPPESWVVNILYKPPECWLCISGSLQAPDIRQIPSSSQELSLHASGSFPEKKFSNYRNKFIIAFWSAVGKLPNLQVLSSEASIEMWNNNDGRRQVISPGCSFGQSESMYLVCCYKNECWHWLTFKVCVQNSCFI